MAIFCYNDKNGNINTLITGYVSQPPKLVAEGKIISFSVGYSKGAYMSCSTFSDSPSANIAGMLEKHDTVLVSGLTTTNSKDGKTYTNLMADCILASGPFPMAAPASPSDTAAPAGGDGQFTEW